MTLLYSSRHAARLLAPAAAFAATDDRRPHAVVIGSGFGGLAAAVRLGARGYRVPCSKARRARRPRLCPPPGRLHLRRRPDLITAPFLFEELWQLCGQRLADDVELRPVDAVLPHPLPRRRDVRLHAATPTAMRAEVGTLVAGRRRRLRALHAGERGDLPASASSSSATCRSTRGPTWRRIVPDMVRLQSYRTVYGLVSQLHQGRAAAQCAQLPSAAGRRQSVHHHLDLLPDRATSSGTGACTSRWAAPAQLVQGLVGLIEGQGGSVRCGARSRARSLVDATAPRPGVRLADGEEIAADVVVSNADSAWTYRHLLAPAERDAAGPTASIERSRYSMSLFVWYFGTRRQYPDVPHHTILLGPRYRELLARHLQAQGAGATTSASTCTARPPPIRRWRRRAAMPSTCSRRCRISAAAPTGRETAEPYRQALSRSISSDTCCRAWRPRSSPRACHAAGLPGPPARRSAVRRSGWSRCYAERLVPAAQPQRGRREPLPGRRRHPSRRGPARRAVLRARSRHGGARCRSRSPEPHRTARRSRRLPRAAARGFAHLLRRVAPAAAGGARAGHRALCVLPPGRRRGRRSATAGTAALARLRDRLDAHLRRTTRATDAVRSRARRRGRRRFAMPRALPEALLEGFAWDARGPPLRDLDRSRGLRRARRRHGRRDDGAC